MKYFIILAIVLVATSNAKSDLCVPEKISDIKLDSYFLLTWSTTETSCAIAKFMIEITGPDQNFPYTFFANESKLALASLLSCQNYTINICGISDDDVAGPTAKKDVFTSISKDADLTVSLKITSVTSEALLFDWDLNDHSLDSCVSSYELTYFSEDSKPVVVSQTGREFTIINPPSCMKYTFEVKALVLDSEVSAPTSNVTVRTAPSAPPSVPDLLSKEAGTTSVDLSFAVPPYEKYRCEFSLIVLIQGMDYKETHEITVPDNAQRSSSIKVHVDNLKADNVYDVYASDENKAGKSNKVTFIFQTLDTILES